MELDELLAPSIARGAQWSICLRRNDEPDAIAEHEPDTVLRTASVAKIFVLLELANRLAREEIEAQRLVDRRSVAPVHDSGLWHAMRVDALPVVDLAVLVGAVSDNWATNALIELLGLDTIQALARRLATGGSMLHDVVRDERSSAHAATLSEGCAADWATVMQRLHHVDAGRQVLDWLGHDADLSMVAGAFGLDPLAHDVDDLGLRLNHKTGTDLGVRADVGVVGSSEVAVAYAAICNWPLEDTSAQTRRVVLAAMRRIGEGISALVAPANHQES